MKLRPAFVIPFALTTAVVACRRHPPVPGASSNTGAGVSPAVAPSGTTPAPAGQAQITGAGAAGESSVVSVPPTPATGCPATVDVASLGPGTVHNGTVNTNETWTLEGSPHRLPSGIDVQSGATLTIAPCAVVLVSRGQWLDVSDGGALVAVGDAQHPIRVSSNEPSRAAGDWNGLNIEEHARPTTRIAYATLEFGGADTSLGGRGCVVSAAAGTDLEHVTLDHCRGFGVALLGEGGFAPSAAALTVSHTEAGGLDHSGAVSIDSLETVGTLPAGTYTGNAIDEVFLSGHNASIHNNATWRNPGVRYHVADNTTVALGGPTSPTLTIAPGTTLAMGTDAEIDVGWDAEGALVADGQADATRITFTAVANEPDPGAWRAIYFGEHYSRARSRLSYVNIAYAGGNNSQNIACPWPNAQEPHAGVYVYAPPTNPQMVSHVRFTNLPPADVLIARNWQGPPTDFFAPALGNEFANSGVACHQSAVKSAAGDCPDPAPCQ